MAYWYFDEKSPNTAELKIILNDIQYNWHNAVSIVGDNIIKRDGKMGVKLSITYVGDKAYYIVKLQLSRTITKYIFQIMAFEHH